MTQVPDQEAHALRCPESYPYRPNDSILGGVTLVLALRFVAEREYQRWSQLLSDQGPDAQAVGVVIYRCHPECSPTNAADTDAESAAVVWVE
jgi:hypothetical protein